MEYKEAIEFIGDVLIVADMKEYDFDDSPGLVDRLQNLDIEDNFKEVIDLLQQGEKDAEELKKVWQMWRELENMYGSSLTWGIEQKYFPKEAKHENSKIHR